MYFSKAYYLSVIKMPFKPFLIYFFQVTKERLQLERHLQIANDSLQRNNGFDLQKYITLEQSNQFLRQQLDSLDLLQQEHKLVEIQYREKEEACR